MKKILLYIGIFLLIIIPLLGVSPVSARGTIQSGFCKVYEKDPEPVLQLLLYLSRGQRNGLSWKFFPSGEFKEAAWYRNDLRHGTQQRFSSDGRLMSSADFKEGQLEGILEEYGEKGQLLSRRRYVLGQLHGPAEYYNTAGVLQRKVIYKEGRAVHMEEF